MQGVHAERNLPETRETGFPVPQGQFKWECGGWPAERPCIHRFSSRV